MKKTGKYTATDPVTEITNTENPQVGQRHSAQDGDSSFVSIRAEKTSPGSFSAKTPIRFLNRIISGYQLQTKADNLQTGKRLGYSMPGLRIQAKELLLNNSTYAIPDYAQINIPVSARFSFRAVNESWGGGTQISSAGIMLRESYLTAGISASNKTTLGNRNPNNEKFQPITYEAMLEPVKDVKISTAIMDSGKNTHAPNAAKLGMSINMNNVVLNVNYAYVDNKAGQGEFRKHFFNTLFAEEGIKDSTTVGLTFFIDSQKRYSLFIGNQYYNTMNYRKNDSSRTMLPSFMATFKARASGNVSYFLNFQNQPYKDQTYLNSGLVRLPIATQSTFDYAAVLGLEQSF